MNETEKKALMQVICETGNVDPSKAAEVLAAYENVLSYLGDKSKSTSVLARIETRRKAKSMQDIDSYKEADLRFKRLFENLLWEMARDIRRGKVNMTKKDLESVRKDMKKLFRITKTKDFNNHVFSKNLRELIISISGMLSYND